MMNHLFLPAQRMRFFLLICIGIVGCCGAALTHAQSSKAIELISDAQNHRFASPEDGLDEAEQAYKLAKRDNDTHLQAKALLASAILYQTLDNYAKAEVNLLEAIELIKNDSDLSLATDIYFQISELYRIMRHMDKAKTALVEAKRLAISTGNREKLTTIIMEEGHLFRDSKQPDKAKEKFLEALEIALELKSDSAIVYAYRNLGQLAKKMEDVESAIYYNDLALKILEQGDDLYTLAVMLDFQATNQRKMGLYAPALSNALRALKIQRSLNNKERIAKILLNLSIIHRQISVYDSALDYASELLSIREEQGNLNGIASASNSMGLIYYHLGQPEIAKEYYQKTLDIDPTKIKLKYRASAYREMANLQHKTNNHALALQYAKTAEDMYRKLGNKHGLATVDRIMGQIYKDMGDNGKALVAYKESHAIAVDIQNPWNQADALIQIGKLLVNDDIVEARKNAREGLRVARDISAKSLMREAYQALISIEKREKNYELAFGYSIQESKLTREISKAQVNQRISELQIVREIEKKDIEMESLRRKAQIIDLQMSRQQSELEILSQRDQINKLKFKNERNLRIILIAVISAVVAVLILVLYRYQYTRRRQIILEEKHSDIENKNAIYHDYVDALMSLLHQCAGDGNVSVRSFRQRLSDLEDCIKSGNIVSVNRALAEFRKDSDNIELSRRDVLRWLRSQLKTTLLEPSSVNVHGCMADAQQNYRNLVLDKHVQISNLVDPKISIETDKKLFTALLTYLLSISVKYAARSSNIDVTARIFNKRLEIKIHSRGEFLGDQSLLHLLEKVEQQLKNLESETEVDYGLPFGMMVCEEYLQRCGGSVTLASAALEDNEIVLHIPISLIS